VNASMAAAAYAKLRNGLGCCIGTSGPGASHLTTGLLDAELDKCPVLCITGQKNSDKIGYSDFQDIGQTELFKAAGIASSQSIIHKNSVLPLLRDAISNALTKCACSHVAIPVDIQRETISSQQMNYTSRLIITPASSHIEACANYLASRHNGMDRVLIAVGQRAADAGQEIQDLAEMLGVPVVTTLDAKGVIPEDHPQAVGVFGIFGNPGMEASAGLIAAADVVISIGVDEHSQLLMSSKGVQKRCLIEIDTCTNVMELRCNAIHSLTGDIASCCKALREAIKQSAASHNGHTVQQGLNKGLSCTGGKSWGHKHGFKADKNYKRPSTYDVPTDEITPNFCHPGCLLNLLGSRLPERSIVCVDVGDVTLWASLCLCLAKAGQRMLASVRLGTMGYSVCAAMAAVALRPDSHFVVIAGDGGVQMSCNEFATLVQMKAKRLLIIILVNQKLGRVANEVWGGENAPPAAGCDIGVPDFCKLAEAYGGTGFRVTSSEQAQVGKVLDRALSCSGMCVLEVIQNPKVKPLMAKRRPTEVFDVSEILEIERQIEQDAAVEDLETFP